METSIWVSLGLILLLSVILTLASLKRSPGTGVLAAMVLIALATWLRGKDLAALGIVRPESWPNTLLLSLLLGGMIALASALLIEPLADKLTGEKHDHSMFDGIRGNFGALLKWLVVVWLLVAPLEEIIFRGFIMNELMWLLGTGTLETLRNLAFSSALFGIAHWYQGKSGALSTGLIGLLIGIIYIAGGYNLWLPILTHGFINTFGFWLVYSNQDRRLKGWLLKNRGSE